MRITAVGLTLALLNISPVFGDSLRDGIATVAHEVRAHLAPVGGRKTVVIVTQPLVQMGSSADDARAQAAFAPAFLNELRSSRGGEGIEYVDAQYFPEIQRIFESELARVREDPELIRRLINRYRAEGTYDYIVLSRLHAVSGRISIESLVVRPGGFERLVSREISQDLWHGEVPRFSLCAIGAGTRSSGDVTFRDSRGNIVTTEVQTSEVRTGGVAFEVKTEGFFVGFNLLNDREPSDRKDVEYVTDRIEGGIDGIIVRGRRLGLLAGYHYDERKDGLGLKGSTEASYDRQIVGHEGVLGVVFGNLYNGTSLAVAARTGRAKDTSARHTFAGGPNEMWEESGVLARLLWNRTSERMEVRFVLQGGPVRLKYDERYWGVPSVEADYSRYQAGVRLRYETFDKFRVGIGVEHSRLEYSQKKKAVTTLLVRQEDTILFFEVGIVPMKGK